MKCQRCGSLNIAGFSAKCSDGFVVFFKRKSYNDLYIRNVTNGEYVEPQICLDCGQCQGVFPVESPEQEPIKNEENDLIWSKTVSNFLKKCLAHDCSCRKFISQDPTNPIGIGFVCKNCNVWYGITLNDTKRTLNPEKHNFLTDRMSRARFAEELNR